MDGNKFECLYQAKLEAHHLFNEKYKEVNSTNYGFNNIDFKEMGGNDGVVFEGEATEELSGGDTYFLDVLESSYSNDLLFVNSGQNKENKKERVKVDSNKLKGWLS